MTPYGRNDFLANAFLCTVDVFASLFFNCILRGKALRPSRIKILTLSRLFNQGIEVFIDPESQEGLPTWRLGMRLIAHPMFIERRCGCLFHEKRPFGVYYKISRNHQW